MGNKRSKPGKAGSKLWGSFGSNVISHDLNVYQDAINLDKKDFEIFADVVVDMVKKLATAVVKSGTPCGNHLLRIFCHYQHICKMRVHPWVILALVASFADLYFLL